MKILRVFLLAFCVFLACANANDTQKWASEITAGKQIPADKFLAFYLNKDDPKTVVFSETVENINLNFAYDKFHKIPSEKFIAYWVGIFDFKQDTQKMILADFSRANLRIAIDSEQIYDSENARNKAVTHKFSKGRHKIEVWFVNNWHTTDILVDFKDEVKFYEQSKIAEKLKGQNFDIWLAAVYGSSAQDSKINVTLEKTQKPLVVILSSYSAVRWEVSNPHNNKILAVLVFNPVSSINLKENIYFMDDRGYSGDTEMKCYCVGGGSDFHCEGGYISSKNERIKKEFGQNLSGFGGSYSSAVINLPSILIDENVFAKDAETKKQIEADREKCLKSGKINDIFN
ncbi:hypothetical protein [uncultured Campylobacter sp.]|uniref:hypothetical protein n=1 Tax=uncultured Campylobacter sp. TaxID=218934 RepID=UPI00262829AC|nr:hypothetical protein [uncultured Campylobacter sp.]